MALIDTLLPSFAVDYVAIYDSEFRQIFNKARPLRATIRESSKVMEHPVENGSVISDHRIVLPIEIELALTLTTRDYEDTYYSIKQYYLDSSLLNIQTRSDLYRSMVIESMPHEENPEQYDTITIILTLKQVLFTEPRYSVVPRNASAQTTVDKGVQQTKPVSQSTSRRVSISIINSISNLKSWFSS